MTDTLEPFQTPALTHRRYVLAGLSILMAVSGGYVGWQHRAAADTAAAAAAAPPPAIPVSVAAAERRDVPIYLTGLGTVQAFNTVTVKTRVDGELVKVAFTEGQNVKAGDLLAQIDPRPFQATYDQAVAKKVQDEDDLANAKLDLQRLTTSSPTESKFQRQLLHWAEPPRRNRRSCIRELSCGAGRVTPTAGLRAGRD